MYEFTSRVRYSEIGRNRNMSIPALFARLQDCCVFHAESIGCGPFAWEKEQRGFIIVSWQVVLHRMPVFPETITTRTWGYRFEGFKGDRNFTVTDADGQALAEVNSNWVYFDRKAMRPMRVPEEEKRLYGTEPPLDTFEFAPRRIQRPETEPETFPPFEVNRSQIDTNDHMNNIQYIEAALHYAALPEEEPVRQIRVEYIRQRRLGDLLYPARYIDGKKVCVSLDTSEGSPCAIVEFML